MRYIVENIVVENDALTASKSSSYRRTAWITSSHIISALNLPQEHQIRIILAYASVEGYLRRDHYKFKRLAVEYPKYGSDIVRVAGKMLFGIGGPNALRNAKRWLANLPE